MVRQPTFGLSAAGYRSEGGFNGPGEPANQWSAWELTGKVRRPRRPGTLWADPDGVLELGAQAGATVLALSVEWARTEPGPGQVDQVALDRYARIFDSARALGLEPVAVLHDVAHPGWLGEEFWLTPGSPDRFAEHVAAVVTALSPVCRRWVTLRSPNLVAFAGWVAGRHPPRRTAALSDAWAVLDNFLSAHLLAYSAVHDLQADADVLFGVRRSSSYDWQRLLVDLLCAPALGVGRGSFEEWVAGRRARHDAAAPPEDLKDVAWRRAAAATAPFGAGRFRRPSPGRALDLAYRPGAGGPPPTTGSNGSATPARARYPLDGLLVGWLPPALDAVLASRGPVRPWEARPNPAALVSSCREQALATPGLPIWIEDGFSTHRGAPRSDGWDRGAYVRAQLGALEATDCDGEAGGPAAAGYLFFSPAGEGDPTWPAADFGLGNDGARLRRLLDEDRAPRRVSGAR